MGRKGCLGRQGRGTEGMKEEEGMVEEREWNEVQKRSKSERVSV